MSVQTTDFLPVTLSAERLREEIKRTRKRLAALLQSATGDEWEIDYHPLPSRPTPITVVPNTEPAKGDWISTEAAAKIMGCSATYIRSLVDANKLKGKRTGRLIKVSKTSAEALAGITK